MVVSLSHVGCTRVYDLQVCARVVDGASTQARPRRCNLNSRSTVLRQWDNKVPRLVEASERSLLTCSQQFGPEPRYTCVRVYAES